jgi:hypothetical protein
MVGFAGAAVFFAIAAILFFLDKIPAVIGILTGKQASKDIQRIWERQHATDSNTGRFAFFQHRQSAKGVRSVDFSQETQTLDLDDDYRANSEIISEVIPAKVRGSGRIVDIGHVSSLASLASSGNSTNSGRTAPLGLEAGQTVLLRPEAKQPVPQETGQTELLRPVAAERRGFRIVCSETVIHTDKVIE